MILTIVCFALAVSVPESSIVLSSQGIFNLCWQKSGILRVDHSSIEDQLETHSADFRFLVCSS